MSDEPQAAGRRRRRRRRAEQGQDARGREAPTTTPTAPGPPAAAAASKQARRRPARDAAGADRGLRDIVGAGSSQVGVSGALRARDVNRPTEEDLAEAERDVVIIRRNWKPPT
ncbi:MAG TPA: hypothetical protein VKB75_02455 [Jatrophihabitans sp.]|nr:hypothetical protein [Jatrophihabitans sp.]